MHELIKLNNTTIGEQEVQTVNARDLHEFLEVSSRYNDWIRNRITKYEFEENVDYVCLTKTLVTQTEEGREGSSTQKDHYISLDMAKELSMVENNEKGRQARKYFIECEKALNTISQKDKLLLNILKAEGDVETTLAIKALDSAYIKPLETKVIQQGYQITSQNIQLMSQAETIKQTLPKASYYDMVLQSPELMTVSQIAKDFGLTGQKLNKILAEEKVQFKDKSGMWILYAKYLTNNYAQSTTSVWRDKEDNPHTSLLMKWTQKGRLFIYDLLKSKGILPVCEREG